jgi:hypothetical protein
MSTTITNINTINGKNISNNENLTSNTNGNHVSINSSLSSSSSSYSLPAGNNNLVKRDYDKENELLIDKKNQDIKDNNDSNMIFIRVSITDQNLQVKFLKIVNIEKLFNLTFKFYRKF